MLKKPVRLVCWTIKVKACFSLNGFRKWSMIKRNKTWNRNFPLAPLASWFVQSRQVLFDEMERLWFYTTRKDTWVISMITSPWFFLFLSAILKQCLRLGRGCVELHYGSALEDEFWPIILCDLVIPSNIRKKTHSAIRHYTNPAVRLKPDQPAPKCPEYVYSELFAFACIPWFDALSSSIGSSHGRIFWQHLTLFHLINYGRVYYANSPLGGTNPVRVTLSFRRKWSALVLSVISTYEWRATLFWSIHNDHTLGFIWHETSEGERVGS